MALTFALFGLLAGAAAAETLPNDLANAQILSPADVAHYRAALEAARAGRLVRAVSLADEASDDSLKGYVLAAAYLSPRSKRTPLPDLIAWLKNYCDLAVADPIYRLAVLRASKKVRRGRKTIIVAYVTDIPVPSTAHSRSGGYEDSDPPDPVMVSDVARAALPQILQDIKSDRPDDALIVLQSAQAANAASPGEIAYLSHRVAASYLAEGMDDKAFVLAANVSDPGTPILDWDAGFSAYRLGRYDEAASHLERLAKNPAASSGLRAQGGFWAARAHMQAGDPAKVVTLLQAAAKEDPTFYGLIAERLLGIDPETGFSDPVLTEADFGALMQAPAAHRAVALAQLDESDYVGTELNRAFGDNDPQYDPAMAALARDLGVTNVELRASEKSAARGILLTGLFPVPQYSPADGYRIDPSLLLAFARIESRFQALATSPVGARGIMQLMPATARAVGGPGASAQLSDPATSLALGQRYIEQLLTAMNGNLLEVGGAYNAGPGSVTRWRGANTADDPLLFVESIPVAETRSYVKRLMEYQWMYRRRFGKDAPSLDQTARGEWPVYAADTDSTAPQPASTGTAPAPTTQVSDAGN